VATLAVVVWLWGGRRLTRADAGVSRWTLPDVRSRDFALSFGAAVAASLSCSPYTQWYESGLLIIPVLLAIDQSIVRTGALTPMTLRGVVTGFLCIPVYYLAPLLGWQPLTLLPPVLLAWLASIRLPDVTGGAT
jgi:hypothetical protein